MKKICITLWLLLLLLGFSACSDASAEMERAQRMALAEIGGNYPQLVENMKMRELIYENDGEFQFVFQYYLNGYPVQGAEMIASVNGNHDDGDRVNLYPYEYLESVTDFNLSDYGEKIDIAEAAGICKEAISSDLCYISMMNDGEFVLRPVYPTQQITIHAMTGELLDHTSFIKRDLSIRHDPLSLLTSDKDQIVRDENLIPEELLEDILREALIPIVQQFEITMFDLSITENDQYVWIVLMDHGHCILDAETGELLSYRKFLIHERQESGEEMISDYNRSLAKAVEFVQNSSLKAPEKISLTGYEENDSMDVFTFHFSRTENSIPVLNEGIQISINQHSGEIVEYVCCWSKDVKVVVVDRLVSSDDAFESYDETSNFILGYRLMEDATVQPAYFFERYIKYAIDAEGGMRVNLDGSLYVE